MSETPEPGTPWKYRLSMLLAAHFVGTIHIGSVLALAPVISKDLSLTATQIGLLATAYNGAQVTCAPFAGTLTDRLGVGWSMVAASVFLAAGSLALAASHGLPLALVAMGLMGIGYAFVNPSTAKAVLEWFRREYRGTVMSAKQTGVPIGGVVGASSLYFATLLDWRIIMVIIAATALAYGLLATTLAQRPEWRQGTSIASLLGRILDTLRNRNLATANLAATLYNVGQQNFYTYMTLFMREATLATQPFASLCLGLGHVGSATARIFWGWFSDRFAVGRRATVMAGLGIAAAACFAALAFAGPGWGIWLGAAMAFGLGLTIAGYAGVSLTVIVETVAPDRAGAAMGGHLCCTAFGGMVGPPIFGAIVDHGGFTYAWLFTGLLAVIGVLLYRFVFVDVADRRPES